MAEMQRCIGTRAWWEKSDTIRHTGSGGCVPETPEDHHQATPRVVIRPRPGPSSMLRLMKVCARGVMLGPTHLEIAVWTLFARTLQTFGIREPCCRMVSTNHKERKEFWVLATQEQRMQYKRYRKDGFNSSILAALFVLRHDDECRDCTEV